MKSIKQQYIDLQEGRMSQANFMRNLRMTMPQYVTNVTSFNDSVKILRNKGILSEADEKGKWTNADGKAMYGQFKEIDNLNGQEVLIGIDWEMQKDHELTKEEAAKIVIKNLKKNPLYYTAEYMSGKEGYEPEYMGGKSANAEARQMQPLDKNMGNVVDKKMGMQPVKGVEKPKKDSDKATAEKYKTSGIDLMSLVAKASKGVQKMDATGEKMKKVAMKEGEGHVIGDIKKGEADSIIKLIPDAEFETEIEPGQVERTSVSSKTKSDKEIQAILDKIIKMDEGDDKKNVPNTIFDKNANITKGIKALTKERLMQIIREELDEIAGAYGGDAMNAEDGSSYVNE